MRINSQPNGTGMTIGSKVNGPQILIPRVNYAQTADIGTKMAARLEANSVGDATKRGILLGVAVRLGDRHNHNKIIDVWVALLTFRAEPDPASNLTTRNDAI